MARYRVYSVARVVLISLGLTLLTIVAIHPDDAGATAWAVLAICAAAVAAAWFVAAAKARRERGLATTGKAHAWLGVKALLAAVAIVGLANLAFLSAFEIAYDAVAVRGPDIRRYSDLGALDWAWRFGVILGAAAGFALRRALDPSLSDEGLRPRLRRFGPLAALSLAGLALIGCEMAPCVLSGSRLTPPPLPSPPPTLPAPPRN